MASALDSTLESPSRSIASTYQTSTSSNDLDNASFTLPPNPATATSVATTLITLASAIPDGDSSTSVEETILLHPTSAASEEPRSMRSDINPAPTGVPSEPTSSETSTLPRHISGWKILLSLMALAANTSQQRSGADDFPLSESISIARVSPLICLADMLVMAITILWCIIRGKQSLSASIAVYLHNTARTDTRDLERSPLGSGAVLKAFVFCLGLLGAFTIFTTEGIDVRTCVWTSAFFAAPLVHLVLRLVGGSSKACEDAKKYIQNPLADSNRLLRFADMIWSLGYCIQFYLWIQVLLDVTSLPALSGSNARWTNIVLGGIICAALLVSSICDKRMFQKWSIRNWSSTDQKTCVIACIVAGLGIMPDDAQGRERWRHNVFIPLAAFGIVVLELFISTLVMDLLCWIRRELNHTVEPMERVSIHPKLEGRLNPLLGTAPDRWRATLMTAFMFCQLTFAALHFGLLYDGSGTSVTVEEL